MVINRLVIGTINHGTRNGREVRHVRGEQKYIGNFSGRPKEKRNLEDLDIHGSIMLKWTLKE